MFRCSLLALLFLSATAFAGPIEDAIKRATAVGNQTGAMQAPAFGGSMNPVCNAQIMAAQTACSPSLDGQTAAPEDLAAARAQYAAYRSAAAPYCTDPGGLSALAMVDACLATLDKTIATSMADAATRRAAADVAKLKADPEYPTAKSGFDAAVDARTASCDQADAARRIQSVLTAELVKVCNADRSRESAASDRLRTIAVRNGIDARDGHALGVW